MYSNCWVIVHTTCLNFCLLSVILSWILWWLLRCHRWVLKIKITITNHLRQSIFKSLWLGVLRAVNFRIKRMVRFLFWNTLFNYGHDSMIYVFDKHSWMAIWMQRMFIGSIGLHPTAFDTSNGGFYHVVHILQYCLGVTGIGWKLNFALEHLLLKSLSDFVDVIFVMICLWVASTSFFVTLWAFPGPLINKE